MERYNFKEFEDKWQKIWEDNKTFQTKVDKKKEKFYCLEMFPYPKEKFTWDTFGIILLVMFIKI